MIEDFVSNGYTKCSENLKLIHMLCAGILSLESIRSLKIPSDMEMEL